MIYKRHHKIVVFLIHVILISCLPALTWESSADTATEENIGEYTSTDYNTGRSDSYPVVETTKLIRAESESKNKGTSTEPGGHAPILTEGLIPEIEIEGKGHISKEPVWIFEGPEPVAAPVAPVIPETRFHTDSFPSIEAFVNEDGIENRVIVPGFNTQP
ncbi:MAG: hypothetical protein ABIH89_06710 [Elusimicrobiota bacterium]